MLLLPTKIRYEPCYVLLRQVITYGGSVFPVVVLLLVPPTDDMRLGIASLPNQPWYFLEQYL